MKKIILLMVLAVLMTSIVTAITADRTLSATTVAPGGTFTVKYVESGGVSPYFVAVVDDVTGGCTISGGTHVAAFIISPSTETSTYTVTAPASGSCTFTGFYNPSNPNSNINFASQTVTVTGGTGGCTYSAWAPTTCPASCTQTRTVTSGTGCTEALSQPCTGGSCPTACTDSTWTPSTSTVCLGTGFTQTSNCGNTRTATGTKDCTVDPADSCEVYQTYNTTTGKCATAGWVWIVGLFLGVVIVFKMMK